MADAVTSQTLFDGNRLAVMKFTNVSDGTGETNVVKVDVAALQTFQGKACSTVDIFKIYAMTHGMEVSIRWAATTPVVATIVPQNVMQTWDMTEFGGIQNNAGATGKTGNITFTTVDQSAGDTYSIILVMKKIY
jgi:hypothetical protein